MNYRHHYHAGNFADVMKHAVLVQLVRGLQRKDKGFLYLDTHAGRGSYDLTAAHRGDTLERNPEHPDGIGRLIASFPREILPGSARVPRAAPGVSPDAWERGHPAREGLGGTPKPARETRALPEPVRAPDQTDSTSDNAPLADYLRLVRDFDRRSGNLDPSAIRYYPGSPSLVRALMRPQDRMALCEMHPAEFQSLRDDMYSAGRAVSPKPPRMSGGARGGFGETALPAERIPANISVHEMDGYTSLRAMLPAPEKRALVLIDPPYETQNEYEQITKSLRDALRRMNAATCAVWYPLTERARANEFLDKLAMLNPPPTLAAELAIAGEATALKMRGCGLAIINPPWQIDQTLKPMLAALAQRLAQAPGAESRLEWIVRE